MMKPSSFYRLIKSMPCSSFVDGWILKQYHTIPAAILGATITGAIDDSKSFSLIHPHLVPGLDGSWTNNQTSSCQILLPGMILLKKYITTLGQVGIVNTCQRWGVPQGLYEPLNQYGEKLRLRMTCFGRNWDPITGYEKQDAPQKNIPYELIHLANTSIKDAQAHLNLLPSNFELPSMSPDMCLVNFYSCSGRLGIHQDCDESDDTLRKGLPVVSFSVGDAAEFWYGHTRDENKLRRVILESGDVLIFGGKSRLIYHGVKKILTNTSPWSLLQAVQLRPGRLNVTLRQF
ncbi:hypothetical protein QVD17_11321 [Tagetes erecta]|uniref:Fe2OG dioxygenase domain-containing protein n=1 Tax=Tagetes erecta TaxID=13708 RepID=A0AAD8KT86_TARER|nr:hypothetical protein QVD17_11321 [Tagetes erecta]